MHLNIKKPSELDIVIPIVEIHAAKDGIACFCPECGVEHTWEDQWPIDIRIHCGIRFGGEVCTCIFIIPNDVAIEE